MNVTDCVLAAGLVALSFGGVAAQDAKPPGVQAPPTEDAVRVLDNPVVCMLDFDAFVTELRVQGFVPVVFSVPNPNSPTTVGGDMLVVFMHGDGRVVVTEIESATGAGCAVASGFGAESSVFSVRELLGPPA